MRVIRNLIEEMERRQEKIAAMPDALRAHAGSPAAKDAHRVHQAVISQDVIEPIPLRVSDNSVVAQALPSSILPISVAAIPELWAHRSQVQKVCAGLYVTNFFGSRNLPRLQSHEITHVVVCANELPIVFPNHFSYL
ncbi:MAG: hypothetical protein EOO38_28820, partial [Cytophagaceae bacterium]